MPRMSDVPVAAGRENTRNWLNTVRFLQGTLPMTVFLFLAVLIGAIAVDRKIKRFRRVIF